MCCTCAPRLQKLCFVWSVQVSELLTGRQTCRRRSTVTVSRTGSSSLHLQVQGSLVAHGFSPPPFKFAASQRRRTHSAARACDSRFILLNPPSSPGASGGSARCRLLCTISARIRLGSLAQAPRLFIWILATLISSVRLSISNVTFDIEDFDIVCSIQIDGLHFQYRMLISKVFDIEGLIVLYRRSPTFNIEGRE